MPVITVLDCLLVAGILALATLTLTARDFFIGIVLFISNGLLIALAWARLGAPDIAIAEAAIGAGLSGALLLAAWRRLQSTSTSQAPPLSPEADHERP